MEIKKWESLKELPKIEQKFLNMKKTMCQLHLLIGIRKKDKK